jgi:hypothetical protein
MRLRIERVQGGVEFVCRKATALIVVSCAAELAVMMRVEASEEGLTQSEHLSVVVLKLLTRRYVVPYARVSAVVDCPNRNL